MIEAGGFKRFAIIALGLLGLIVLVYPQPLQAATLTDLLRRQAELQRQANENKLKIEQKQREANNLQNAISDLDDDIGYTQGRIANTESQIETTQQVIDELNAEIQQTQTQLDALNEKLRIAYVSVYELSQTSTAESILQSDSLTELVSQTQYIQAIQSELQANIDKANSLKSDLETKKQSSEAQRNELENLKKGLDSSKSALNRQRAQKDYLLDQTQGEQAKYEQLLVQIRAESSRISDEIYRQRLSQGGFLNQSGTGGYPWAGRCDLVDPWLFYTCQCTSYAAWKFQQIHGVPFRNTRPGAGSAYNWPALAADQGYTVSSSPRVGDAVSWNRPLFAGDQWGHVAIVDAVFSANDIIVSEYNWNRLVYSQRRINPNSSGTPRYIRP